MKHRLQGSGMTSRRTRERMVSRLKQQGITNSLVLSVMAEIPRHVFVDEALESRAYEDTALPIGHNQTISQPYIVARMTELLLEKGPWAKSWRSAPVAAIKLPFLPNLPIKFIQLSGLSR